MSAVVRTLSPLLAFVDWLYGRRAAGIDLLLGLLAAGWCTLMLFKPAMFDKGAFVGLALMSDAAWIWLMAAMSSWHALGLLRPSWRNLRTGAALASSWAWLFVSFSLSRVEFSTGVWAYGLIGAGALFGAIHLAGLPRERG